MGYCFMTTTFIALVKSICCPTVHCLLKIKQQYLRTLRNQCRLKITFTVSKFLSTFMPTSSPLQCLYNRVLQVTTFQLHPHHVTYCILLTITVRANQSKFPHASRQLLTKRCTFLQVSAKLSNIDLSNLDHLWR